MSVYLCKSCGHAVFDETPRECPGCSSDSFLQNDTIFEESAEKSKEAAVKHIPSIQIKKECGLIPEGGCTDVLVRIGKQLHPMEEKHFIRFIDCYIDKKFIGRVTLTPAMHPAACFHLKSDHGATVTVVENCTIHGYWKLDAPLA